MALPSRKLVRKIAITTVGGLLLLFTLVFIFLPGTVVLLPIALTILALEYQWARRYVKHAQSMLTKSAKKADQLIKKLRTKRR